MLLHDKVTWMSLLSFNPRSQECIQFNRTHIQYRCVLIKSLDLSKKKVIKNRLHITTS